jgi:hypothetical protein
MLTTNDLDELALISEEIVGAVKASKLPATLALELRVELLQLIADFAKANSRTVTRTEA